MDIIYDELRQNNIEIDKDTLSFYLESLLTEQQELYECVNGRICGDDLVNSLSDIHREIQAVNFGRIIAYLALVLKVSHSLDEQTIREAVRRTIEDFKRIDIKDYVRKPAGNWGMKVMLGKLFLKVLFAYYNVQQSH